MAAPQSHPCPPQTPPQHLSLMLLIFFCPHAKNTPVAKALLSFCLTICPPLKLTICPSSHPIFPVLAKSFFSSLNSCLVVSFVHFSYQTIWCLKPIFSLIIFFFIRQSPTMIHDNLWENGEGQQKEERNYLLQFPLEQRNTGGWQPLLGYQHGACGGWGLGGQQTC